MSQFASTLYPQTNPTNRSLLAFRDDCKHYSSASQAASTWLTYFEDLRTYGRSFSGATDAQNIHTHRVLTRLAALSG